MSTIPTTAPNYGSIPPTTVTTATTTSSSSSIATFLTPSTTPPRPFLSPRRPWREFLSLPTFSLPSSYSEAMARIRRNLNYFRFNYSIITLIILFLSLLWNPISMIVFLAIFVLWIFLYFSREQPILIFGREVDDRIVLCGLFLGTIFALVWTHVGVNVLVALAVAVVVVGVHAGLRNMDDLFLEEEEIATEREEGRPLRPTYARVG